MSDLLREGRAAAATERQMNFAPQLGLVARLCDEIERLRAELAITTNALHRACPASNRIDVDWTLVRFHLRHATEAVEAAGRLP